MGMNISDFFDMDVLIQILTDWSTATGIGIIAVDEPDWLERFLYEIHKRNKGRITPMCKM